MNCLNPSKITIPVNVNMFPKPRLKQSPALHWLPTAGAPVADGGGASGRWPPGIDGAPAFQAAPVPRAHF